MSCGAVVLYFAHHIILYYVVLCCVVLCCIVLCCVVLCCVVTFCFFSVESSCDVLHVLCCSVENLFHQS